MTKLVQTEVTQFLKEKRGKEINLFKEMYKFQATIMTRCVFYLFIFFFELN